jgi:hypothetical protein
MACQDVRHVKKVIEEKIPNMSTKKQHLFFLDNDEELDNATPFVKLKLKEGVQLAVFVGQPFKA